MKRVFLSLAALSLAAGGFVAAAGAPASAATSCNDTKDVDTTSGFRYEPSTSSGSLNCVLGNGNQGTAVRALQDALKKCNGRNIDVDGVYGTQTKNAVIAVQNAHHLTPDGVYGPDTRAAMKWVQYDARGNQSCHAA